MCCRKENSFVRISETNIILKGTTSNRSVKSSVSLQYIPVKRQWNASTRTQLQTHLPTLPCLAKVSSRDLGHYEASVQSPDGFTVSKQQARQIQRKLIVKRSCIQLWFGSRRPYSNDTSPNKCEFVVNLMTERSKEVSCFMCFFALCLERQQCRETSLKQN